MILTLMQRLRREKQELENVSRSRPRPMRTSSGLWGASGPTPYPQALHLSLSIKICIELWSAYRNCKAKKQLRQNKLLFIRIRDIMTMRHVNYYLLTYLLTNLSLLRPAIQTTACPLTPQHRTPMPSSTSRKRPSRVSRPQTTGALASTTNQLSTTERRPTAKSRTPLGYQRLPRTHF